MRFWAWLLLCCVFAGGKVEAGYEVDLSALEALELDGDVGDELPLPKVAPTKTITIPETQTVEKVKEVKQAVIEVVEPEKPAQSAEAENVAEKEDKISELVEAEDSVENLDKESDEAQAEIQAAGQEEIVEIMTPDIEKSIPKATDISSVILVFGADSDVLASDVVETLDEFVSNMDPQHAPKLLIEAFNYNNGENSFARKRINLNRGVAVRSYLLGRGFKSFSIKIINTEDAELQNIVQVSY